MARLGLVSGRVWNRVRARVRDKIRVKVWGRVTIRVRIREEESVLFSWKDGSVVSFRISVIGAAVGSRGVLSIALSTIVMNELREYWYSAWMRICGLG